jgi:hypothetical protein
MELDFRHSELLANPVHLLAIHIAQQYVQLEKTSTTDTFLLHQRRICVILYFMEKTAFACHPGTSLSRARSKDSDQDRPLCHYDPGPSALHSSALLLHYDELVLNCEGINLGQIPRPNGEVFPNRNALKSRHTCEQMRHNQHFYSGEIPGDER